MEILLNILWWPRNYLPIYFKLTPILTVCVMKIKWSATRRCSFISCVFKFSSQRGVQGKAQTDREEGRTEESFDGKWERRGKSPYRVYCNSLVYVLTCWLSVWLGHLCCTVSTCQCLLNCAIGATWQEEKSGWCIFPSIDNLNALHCTWPIITHAVWWHTAIWAVLVFGSDLKQETVRWPASDKQLVFHLNSFIEMCFWKPFSREMDNEQDHGSC